jgi:serine/threonine protein kinase
MQRRLTKEERDDHKGVQILKRKATLEKKLHTVVFEDFNLLMVLGRGAFGKVFLAELSINKKLYAIKSIRKDILIEMD